MSPVSIYCRCCLRGYPSETKEEYCPRCLEAKCNDLSVFCNNPFPLTEKELIDARKLINNRLSIEETPFVFGRDTDLSIAKNLLEHIQTQDPKFYLSNRTMSDEHREPKGLSPCPWDELDKGIVPHVRALRRAGLNTIACCQGHKGQGDARPKITLEPLDRETATELRHKAAAVLIGNGFEAFTISEEWLYQHESRPWVGPTPRGLVQISFWTKLPE